MLDARHSTDIRELAVEAPRAPSRALERYLALKNSGLWDGTNEVWGGTIEAGPDDPSDAFTQLLDVLVNVRIDPAEGRRVFKRLLASDYRDDDIWMDLGGAYDADEQAPLSADFLEFIIRCELNDPDPQLAEKACQPFTLKLQLRDWLTKIHLLDILIMTRTDKEDARRSYDELKTTVLYDAATGTWRLHGHLSNPGGDQRQTEEQLLAVLVELELEPSAGKAHYERLLASPLYDRTSGLWHAGMKSDMRTYITANYIVPDPQLLDVLVQLRFEQLGMDDHTAAEQEVPRLLTMN